MRRRRALHAGSRRSARMWRLVRGWMRRRLLLPRGASPLRPLASAAASSCWSCGLALAAAAPRFCPSCRALQAPDPRPDLFGLLGCERRFRLDAARLQQTFRSLQRQLHPDLFCRRPQAEQDFSEQHSALVNRAYRTLRSPLSRGLYLLELSGVEPEPGTDSQADPGFLAEVMGLNEQLAEAEAPAELQEVESLVAAKQEELTEDVSRAFDRGDLQEAKKLLAKMKYFANLKEKLKEKVVPS